MKDKISWKIDGRDNLETGIEKVAKYSNWISVVFKD